MHCPRCESTSVKERPERTAQGYRRFRCSDCPKQFNERSTRLLNRTQYPSDVIALVVLWRLRYKPSLRDLAEMLLIRGFVFSYEAVGCTARSKSAVDHARNRHLITQESGTGSRSKPASDHGANRHRVTE
jgi:transposase-like protein